MNVYAPIILCFVPFITMFLLFAILVPGISILNEFRASLAGLIAFIPIVLLQFFIPELRLFRQVKVVSILLYSLIFCGLIEEGVKAASLLILKAKGETLRNFFLYSLLAGMILGCFESIVYLLQLLQNYNRFGELLPPVKLIHLRMGTSLVIHTLCAGLGGLCIFYGKNIQRNFAPLVFAIVIHGVYDFFAAFGAPLNYFSIAVILLATLECRIIYIRAREELNSANGSKQKILDPNKTIEMPKNPALVISVKNNAEPKGEEEMFFSKKRNGEVEDFDAIQKEAEAALKKSEEKKSVSKTKTQTTEKTVATKTTAKKVSEKTVAKPATKKETAKTTTKKASAKDTSKTLAVSKTAPKKTASAKTVVSKTKATSKAAGGVKSAKTTTTKNASKKSTTRKK